jgi:hypothetical protein
MLNVLSSFVVINRIGSSLVMACDCSPCRGPTLNKIFQIPEKIGIDGVGRMPARARLAIQDLQAHAAHEGGHVPTPNRMAFLPSQIAQHPGTGKRMGQMQRVEPAHQPQIRCRHRRWLVVGRRARQPEELTLPNNW